MLLRIVLNDYFYYVDCLKNCGDLIAKHISDAISSVISGVGVIHHSCRPYFIFISDEDRKSRQGARYISLPSLIGYLLSMRDTKLLPRFDVDLSEISDEVYVSRKEADEIGDIIKRKMRAKVENEEEKTLADLLDDYIFYLVRLTMCGFTIRNLLNGAIDMIVPAIVEFNSRDMFFSVSVPYHLQEEFRKSEKRNIFLQKLIADVLAEVNPVIKLHVGPSSGYVTEEEAEEIKKALHRYLRQNHKSNVECEYESSG